MRKTDTFLGHLRQDTGGNILPLAAVGALVAATIVGSAVDISRSYRVKSQLQAACDAAVLAGRRTVTTNGLDAAATTAANNYFATNFDDSGQETRSTSFVPSSDDNGNTVNGTASTTLDTLVMRLFGYSSFSLSVTCTSSMGVGNSDVMMVLDTTGSMGSQLNSTQTRLQALQAAMKNFYTTLSTATSGSNARLRYGFVPYSTTVNVGRLLYALNPAYLTDRHTYSSRQAVYNETTNTTYQNPVTTYGGPEYKNEVIYNTWTDYQSGYKYESDCNNDKPAVSSSYVDNGSSSSSDSTTTNGSGQQVVTTTTTQPQIQITAVQCVSYLNNKGNTRYKIQTKYKTRDEVTYKYVTSDKVVVTTKTFDHYDYKPVEYDTSIYKTFASVSTVTGNVSGGNPTSVSSTWNGCIHERATVASASFSYSSLVGITPSGASDIDIDTAPDVNNDDTKWAPMWPVVVYNRYTTSTNYWGGTSYTATTGTGTYGERVSSPCPAAAQSLQEMTQAQFDAYADSLVATGNTYLDIGMIWGGRLLSPTGIFANTVNTQPSNGGEVSRHVVFMTDGIMEPNNSVNQAWGLEWWDRKVTSDGSTDDASRHTSRFLAVCDAIKDRGIRIWVIAFTSGLSDNLKTCASDNSSFTANSSTELNTAFQEIAKQVGELRITQ
ncbi:Flp pilus assembly protein TadG [Novosphingobium sp. CF614]|uniref:Tad domain-containing protein n=1 Tax=Novosphingobium sp. CF614 TaxID=1884364 RepID=UPI0008E90DF6|nr:Tad domain-containing protein [Novosphingobium sp. CF614]SFF94546.1 Flp pilus assembly protein TadG [Novosphingobium sp. CF614]